MLSEDVLNLLKILWDANGPMTIQDILKKLRTSDFEKVSVTLQQMEEKRLVQAIETVVSSPAYVPTEESKRQILQHIVEIVRSIKNVVSPYDLGIKIMETALNDAENPEEKLGVIEEFEQMIDDLERWDRKKKGFEY